VPNSQSQGASSVKKITTAVFPVAGRGTRFLPATKACPKEMLPVVDKPLVQYAVEEAVAAGATKIVFVTGRSKRAIEDHFDNDFELERELEQQGKDDLLELLRATVPPGVSFVYVRQPAPLGLGHAVLCAECVVGDEPFFVHLPDDLIHGDTPCLEQMRQVYEATGSSVIATEQVPREHTRRYGIVALDDVTANPARITQIVEKPKPEDAPSTQAVVGRYILTPAIFDLLRTTGRGAGGEIQLTDAIADLLAKESVYSYSFKGTRYDCGNKLGFLRATVEIGLSDPAIAGDFRAVLEKILSHN
jgi:UTP--glucose-1-phosphate uridylyltransferase